jgi:hypothetical protein
MTTAQTSVRQQKQQQYGNFGGSIKSPATLQSYNYALQNYMKHRNVRNNSELIPKRNNMISRIIACLKY